MRPAEGIVLEERYRLARLIATGGMGQVWEGRDETLDRACAVKILREEFTGDPGFLDRFRAEARHTAALAHTNIAALYDYGEIDGTAYIVMELAPGRPLADLIDENPRGIGWRRALPILAQIADGLEAAHDAGVVHRDVKPENILVSETDGVKITDFGIARSIDQTKLTKTGLVMGTAQYLSPEQALGKQATPRSDLYSLGIVTYEMLAGKRPFTGESQVDIAMAQVKEPVPPLPPTVPAVLRDLVDRVLVKEPEGRPRSVASLARAFRAIEHGDRPHLTTGSLPIVGNQERSAAGARHRGSDSTEGIAPIASGEPGAVPGPARGVKTGPTRGRTADAKPQRDRPAAPAARLYGAQQSTEGVGAVNSVAYDDLPRGTSTGRRRRGIGLPGIALIVLIVGAILCWILIAVGVIDPATALTSTAGALILVPPARIAGKLETMRAAGPWVPHVPHGWIAAPYPGTRGVMRRLVRATRARRDAPVDVQRTMPSSTERTPT